MPGEYAIHILCDNEDISQSPFIAQIQTKSNFRPDMVKCSGAGIQPYGVVLNCAVEFKVDTSSAGVAPLEIIVRFVHHNLEENSLIHKVFGLKAYCMQSVQPQLIDKLKTLSIFYSKLKIQDTMGNQLHHKKVNGENGLLTCSYTPKTTLPHVIEVNYGGVAAAESPYRVYVSAPPDVTKIRVFGDWFETKTKLNQCNTFNIDTSDVDIADLNVYLIHEESGEKVPVAITHENRLHTIELNVKKPGNYLTKIYYGGIPLPFTQKVYVPPLPNNYIPESSTPEAYPDRVKVFGPAFSDGSLKAGEATYFNIDVSEAGQGIVAVCIINMDGIPVDNVFVVNKGGGLYTVNFIPPNEKSIVISVKFAHQNVKSR